ncbi:MAG: hypothetical protein GY898_03735 [Proteobacteria bacterium]|nr:hypothetical protein [Pseudomonadota bacterium]
MKRPAAMMGFALLSGCALGLPGGSNVADDDDLALPDDDDLAVSDDDDATDDDDASTDDDDVAPDDDDVGPDDDDVGPDDDDFGDDDDDLGTCLDDGEEPNDTQPAAVFLGAGSLGGLVACDGNDDWFSFAVSAGEAITVNAYFAHSDGDVDLFLHDASGTEVDSAESSSDDEQIGPFGASTGGVWAVRVNLYADGSAPAGSAYQIEVTLDALPGDDDDATPPPDDDDIAPDDDDIAPDDDDATPPPTCTDDGYEDNDTDGAAASIGTGTVSGLQICEDDDDYFAVNLGAGTAIQLDATFSDAEGDLDLRLYDPAGTYVGSSLSVTDDEAIGPYNTASSGDWIIKVDLFSAAGSLPGNSYSLSVGTPGCQADAYEPNDSSGSSAATGTGAWTDYGIALCDGDVDWFKRDLSTGDTIEVDVYFEDGAGDLDLEIYDELGLWTGGSYSGTDDEHVSYTALGAGTHWFRVYLYDDPGDPGQGYDLAVDSY